MEVFESYCTGQEKVSVSVFAGAELYLSVLNMNFNVFIIPLWRNCSVPAGAYKKGVLLTV